MNNYLRSLDADAAGNWNLAHELIQDDPSSDAAWIHAYLHRKEGDQWNAEYWYRRAGKPVFQGSLQDEWQQLQDHFTES
jgi:Tfp pilus assembly protein PilF